MSARAEPAPPLAGTAPRAVADDGADDIPNSLPLSLEGKGPPAGVDASGQCYDLPGEGRGRSPRYLPEGSDVKRGETM